MGGNALKPLITRRVSSTEMSHISHEVCSKLETLFDCKTYPVKSYRLKEDHGDIDILFAGCPINKKDILDKLGVEVCIKNDRVLTFPYSNVQIDLILVEDTYFEVSKLFYDYNDTGAIIGKVFNTLGIKFGYNGLFYKLKDSAGNLVDKIEISRDPIQILNSIELDVSKYFNSFDYIEDVFTWVSSTPYFNVQVFDGSLVTSYQRHRDKKRKILTYFELWCTRNIKYCPHINIDTVDWVNLTFGVDLQYHIDNLKLQESRNAIIKDKFNGNIVIDRFNIHGKDLGDAMNKFKNSFKSTLDYEEFILNNDIDCILSDMYATITSDPI